MKAWFFIILILLISGCTQANVEDNNEEYEPSFLFINSSSPINGSVIDDSTLLYLDIQYDIGNFDETNSYFIGVVLIDDEVTGTGTILSESEQEVNDESGFIENFFIDTDRLGYLDENLELSYKPPYIMQISLNKRLQGYSFAMLANQTLIYQGE